jgi:hypothetical protein
MQRQGEGQEDEQGVAKIAAVADVLLLDGESGSRRMAMLAWAVICPKVSART